jgi:hypothetical protein
MKVDLASLEYAVARAPLAVRVVWVGLALSLVFAMATLAGTSVGRAIYYLSH